MIGGGDIKNDLPKNYRQIMYMGRCVNSDDPYMLGRVRVYPEDQNIADRLASVYNFNEEKDAWNNNDPFVFLPLLPYFIYQVPKVGELVHVIYTNPDYKTLKGQYYIQGPFSSPTSIYNENYNSAKTFLDSGIRNRPYPAVKNKNGTYFNTKTEGVFPEPGDVAILGRNNTDVILKDNEVLIRAGKHNKFSKLEMPTANLNRAFIQLTNYQTTEQYGQTEKLIRLIEEDLNITKLIEYEIYNPENTMSAYTGQIILYNIKPDDVSGKTMSSIVSSLSNLEQFKSIQKIEQFTAKTLPQVIELVNNFIKSVKRGVFDDGTSINNQFPFYYRPNKANLDYVRDFTGATNPNKYTTLISLFAGVKGSDFSSAILGNGLIYDKTGKTSVPKKPQIESYRPKRVLNINKTASIMGADQLYFIANDSANPAKAKVNLTDTLYGITQTKLVDEIQPKTSSMVRGEELLDLLSLIVRFLATHVHPYPGMPPVGVSSDGTKIDDLLKELLEASNKVLNKNIRLN